MARWLAGVDGCRSGWIAVLAPADGDGEAHIRTVPTLEALLEGPDAPDLVGIDIPIGLPDRIVGSGRGPEQAVRPHLGPRRASIFPIPSRQAVAAETYAEACRIARATSEPPRAPSKQGFMIFSKIRAVDAALRRRPDWISRVREVHPELAFHGLNGGVPLSEPKKRNGRGHPPGLAMRRALLHRAGLPASLVEAAPPRGAAADDLLDALAVLGVVRAIDAGRGRPYPDPPALDAFGIPIAIWGIRTEGADA